MQWSDPRERKATDTENPVFVVGYPRSGTTMLYRILATNGTFGHGLPMSEDGCDSAFETAVAFLCNPEMDFTEIGARDWPHWRLAVPDAEALRAVFRSAQALPSWRRTLERALSRHVFGDADLVGDSHDLDSLCTRQKRRWRSPSLRAVAARASVRGTILREFFAAHRRAYGGERVLDKFPFHYYYLFELHAIFPDARFLFLVRDPVDVFASMVRRARVQLAGSPPIGAVAWQLMSAENFARDWLQSLRLADEFANAHPRNILRVEYEALTERPERVLAEIGGFLGLDRALAVPPRPAVAPDASRKFPLAALAPQPNANRYGDLVHPADRRTIVDRCSHHCRTQGHRDV